MASNGKGNGKSGASTPTPPAVEGRPSTNGAHTNGAHKPGSPDALAPEGAREAAIASPSDLPDPEPLHAVPPEPVSRALQAPHPPVSFVSPIASTPDDEEDDAPLDAEPLRGAAWGFPFARFERRWTALESRLLTFVLIAQILSLCAWVFLNGLAESVATTAGCVFRAVLLGAGAGTVTWMATRAKAEDARRNLVLLAVAASLVIVVLWRVAAGSGSGAGYAFDLALVHYFDNIKGWLQEGSTLTLLGGLRGLGTRLTLWLALLGGSLATASGKHIHVDVVFRFLPKSFRLPVAIMNYLFASIVCFAAVWGFFDHIAIESYGSKADHTAGAKISRAVDHVGTHFFFTRKQLGLDLRSLPHVLAGERYDQWMSASTWNDWVDAAGFERRFDEKQIHFLKIEDGTHPAFVVSPDGETTRGALAHTLGLVFPFGLFAIALRFLLRAILTLGGYYAPDPDEAHREEIGHGHTPVSPAAPPAPEGGA